MRVLHAGVTKPDDAFSFTGSLNVPHRRQQTQRNALAIDSGNRGDSDINFFSLDANIDSAILRKAFFGNIHARHDLDSRDEGRLKTFQLRGHWSLMQDTVYTVSDA